MQTFIYSSRDDPDAKRLDLVVRSVIPNGRIESFTGLVSLNKRLRTPVEPDSIAVISIANRKELEHMQRLCPLLTEIYIIMVIPDGEKETLALAHLLLPRFLSRKESDFVDLRVVLAKMYAHTQDAAKSG
jgi:hypothetical protein